MKVEELKRQHELTAHLLVCSLYKRHESVPLPTPTRFCSSKPSEVAPPPEAEKGQETLINPPIAAAQSMSPVAPKFAAVRDVALVRVVFEESDARMGVRREEQEALTELSLGWIAQRLQ